MRVHFTVGIFQEKRDGEDEWTALVPSRYASYISGTGSEARLRERMLERLRDVVKKAKSVDQELFQFPIGTELARFAVEAKAETGKVTGQVPLIIEPRWTSSERQHFFCYHPLRRDHWFITDDRDKLPELAQALVRHHWADIDDEDTIEALLSNGKERLTTLAFSAEAMSLLDMLPSRQKDPRAGAASQRNEQILRLLAVDETQRAANQQLRLGVPRAPYRERLAYLLGGKRPRSAMVVGPPGTGKTLLVNQWIQDRLVEDGYPLHKNLDKCFHVWRLSGKRLIAGMSHLGEWEERCLAVLDDAKKRRGILWIEDLHLFGRLGQSRQSERSFADFFRGPVRRGDLAIVAELTEEQRARLERDAPGLVEALALVAVPAATPNETAHLMLHEIRALEVELTKIELHPFVARTALELGTALFPWRARPGVAIEIVRRVAVDASSRGIHEVGPNHVLEYLARTTGLSANLITLDQPLDASEVEAKFAERVIGQPIATRAAADVIVKVRAGLADPARPVSVMLFTGPTGTGKTELATAIAEYLYGDQSRLVRIDMGEMSGPDAVARLIGDSWNPEGLLTSRVRSQPFCVVLLDEIEKAHPEVFDLLLGVLGEGRLTDASGRLVDFRGTIVIMTSNLGVTDRLPVGFGDNLPGDFLRHVRAHFRPELWNRIDHVLPFRHLTREDVARIVDLELAALATRTGLVRRGVRLEVSADARAWLAENGYHPTRGARPLKRLIEERVMTPLAAKLAAETALRDCVARVTRAGDASLAPLTLTLG